VSCDLPIPVEGAPWWRLTAPIERHPEADTLRAQAAAVLASVRAYLEDPEWSGLEDDEHTAMIQQIVPWGQEDVERLIQAVADQEGGLRSEDDLLEEIAAALRDGHDPELEIHTITPDDACEFIRLHHSHLPQCNRRGIVHALGARWRGQIVAVATAGAPTGRWGNAHTCPPAGTLEITRVASLRGLERYDRRGRSVPVGAASALVARLIDLLPQSGRGAQGCRLITYQRTIDEGTIYRALVAKGLRPVGLTQHRHAGGARSRVALDGPKIRWEAGPAASPPNWTLLRADHQNGARIAWAAFTRKKDPKPASLPQTLHTALAAMEAP
jgi:hypothetical protein